MKTTCERAPSTAAAVTFRDAEQEGNGRHAEEKPCFRTETSYFCTENCELRRACRRWVAEWLRY